MTCKLSLGKAKLSVLTISEKTGTKYSETLNITSVLNITIIYINITGGTIHSLSSTSVSVAVFLDISTPVNS